MHLFFTYLIFIRSAFTRLAASILESVFLEFRF